MNYTKMTLGELLSHASQIIKRQSMGILKELQRKQRGAVYCKQCVKAELNGIEFRKHCKKCGEIHDVEEAGGHDLIQAEKILVCECEKFPEDEFCQQILKK